MGVLSVLFMLSLTFMGAGTAVYMIADKNMEQSVFDIMILHKAELQDFSAYENVLDLNFPVPNKKMYNKKRYFNSQGLRKPVVVFGMSDNTDLDSFTPNFGIIETGLDGRNIIDIGIYNLEADPETGALSQTDTSYLITAGTEHKYNFKR